MRHVACGKHIGQKFPVRERSQSLGQMTDRLVVYLMLARFSVRQLLISIRRSCIIVRPGGGAFLAGLWLFALGFGFHLVTDQITIWPTWAR